MTIEMALFRFAGVMLLLSGALTAYVHAHFIWFTIFIGANLLQFSFTGVCPAATVFKKLGLKAAAEKA